MYQKPATPDASSSRGSGTAAQPAKVESLDTVPLDRSRHRINDFQCAKSERCARFFERDMPRLVKAAYSKVFIYENPNDRDQVWGSYTLSPAEIRYFDLTKSQQREVPGHLPVALARIGFLARDDRAPKKLGAGLLVDAARRVIRSDTMTAWGFILEPDGGPENAKLWGWYKDTMGFTPIIEEGKPSRSLYCPLRRLIPEEWKQRASADSN